MEPLPDTALIRVARRGHRQKTGHELDGYLAESENGKYVEGGKRYVIVRTCCRLTVTRQ